MFVRASSEGLVLLTVCCLRFSPCDCHPYFLCRKLTCCVADDLKSYCTVYEPLTRNHRFINANATHFLVIEIGGGLPIIDEYPLSSLVAVNQVSDAYELAPDEDQQTVECAGPVVQLTFSRVKSTVSLTYVLYDQDEAKVNVLVNSLFVNDDVVYLYSPS